MPNSIQLPKLRGLWAGLLGLANVVVAGAVAHVWATHEFWLKVSVFLGVSVWTYFACLAYFWVTKNVVKRGD